jgi:membrane-associated protease RseP (regulator of RpoE activity)
MRTSLDNAVDFLFKTVGGLFLLFLAAVVIFLALFWPRPETAPGAWLGVLGRDLDAQAVQDYRLPFDRGIIVEDVFPNSPAYFSNLAPGDVIVKFNEQMVYSQDQLRQSILNADPEEQAWMTVYRNGTYYNVMLVLGQRPASRTLPAQAAAQQANAAPPISSNAPETHRYRGVCTNCHVILDGGAAGQASAQVVAALPQAQAGLSAVPAALGGFGPQGVWPMAAPQGAPGANPPVALTEYSWAGIALETLAPGGGMGNGLAANAAGVVVDEIVLGSAGDRGGVQAGDLIREINGTAVCDAQTFANAVQSQQLSGGVLLVTRSGRTMYVTVPEY